MGDLPIIEAYRGVGLHDFQTRERIDAVVKPALDLVFAMSDAKELYEYLRDTAHPPEARLFACAKLKAMAEGESAGHRRAGVDLAKAEAHCAGLQTLRWADPDNYGSLLSSPGGSAAPRPAAMRRRLIEAQGDGEPGLPTLPLQ